MTTQSNDNTDKETSTQNGNSGGSGNNSNETIAGKITISIAPEKVMALLSASEVQSLLQIHKSKFYSLFRRCALAVLNCGSVIDDTKEILELHADFDIRVIQQSRGIKLELMNAPSHAFVDGQIIKGIKEHLFSVLRDVVYINDMINEGSAVDLTTSHGITDATFQIMRHAGVLKTGTQSRLVICWGGHSISRVEYDFTKEIGYQLGLRGMDIGTGCGPGAMKGPMKGATIGHAKQHRRNGRYIGISEPGIIAAEPPNPIVNELVILPDIEKRLEVFVRVAHGIIVFPGGVGTAEEILYLLGLLLHPKNKEMPFPLVFAAPESSRSYFDQINTFIGNTLGTEAQTRYKIIVGDAANVAREVKNGIDAVYDYRRTNKDAFYFNWLLHIDREFQTPFEPTHDNMAQLNLSKKQPAYQLAANLRRAFSGMVAGNVKESGIKRIQAQGPYEIKGDPEIMGMLDTLLQSFVNQGRMKLGDKAYQPCYRIIR